MCRSTRHGEFPRRRKSNFVELSTNSIIVCGSPMLSCQRIGCVWISESFLLVSWLLPPHQRSSLVSSAQDKRAPEVSDLLCLLLHDCTGRPCPCSPGSPLSPPRVPPRARECGRSPDSIAHPRASTRAQSRRFARGPCRAWAVSVTGRSTERAQTRAFQDRQGHALGAAGTPHPRFLACFVAREVEQGCWGSLINARAVRMCAGACVLLCALALPRVSARTSAPPTHTHMFSFTFTVHTHTQTHTDTHTHTHIGG